MIKDVMEQKQLKMETLLAQKKVNHRKKDNTLFCPIFFKGLPI